MHLLILWVSVSGYLNSSDNFVGITCGHFYFFLEDVFPNQQNGWRFLKTPAILHRLFDERQPETVPEDERPGGFGWGAQENAHLHDE